MGVVGIVAVNEAVKSREVLSAEGETVFTLGEIRALPVGEAPTVVI